MGRDDDFRCRWLKHPLRNFQRGSTWRSNYDPLTAPNRVVDDLQFLPRISVESIVNRNSGTIGILKGCCCSASSILFLPDLTLGPCNLLTYSWLKTARHGLIFSIWGRTASSKFRSRTPALTALSKQLSS